MNDLNSLQPFALFRRRPHRRDWCTPNRHTLITELAESGAGDETIMEIAGHIDRQMLRHYSHIRMKAKREAVESVIASRKGNSRLGSASKAGASA